jgi:hypothetical protein
MEVTMQSIRVQNQRRYERRRDLRRKIMRIPKKTLIIIAIISMFAGIIAGCASKSCPICYDYSGYIYTCTDRTMTDCVELPCPACCKKPNITITPIVIQ